MVPKAIRQQLGLKADTPFTITVQKGTMVLEPAPADLRLVRRGKGLVAESAKPLPPLTAQQVRAVLEAERR